MVERSDDEVLTLLSKIKDSSSKLDALENTYKNKKKEFENLSEGKFKQNSEEKISTQTKGGSKKKKSILEYDFETTYHKSPLEMKKYSFEPPIFPDVEKEDVKQEILQDKAKEFNLTFITYIRDENDFKHAKKLVFSILKLLPKATILIGSSIDKKKIENVEYINFESTTTLGKMINTLLKETKTELGLLLKPNSLVNRETDLKKIFEAFTHTDAVIVSGSNRDIDTGELYLPCYRIFLQRWTYQIEYGYSGTLYYKNESPVAICQRTELPMTFKLSKLKSNQFFDELITDDDLTIEEYYIKMSLHIKSVVTPHTMFHVRRKRQKSINKPVFIEKWMPLAKKYRFDNIIEFGGKRKFLCREDWTLTNNRSYFMMDSLYTPTCNYRTYHLFFKFFFEFFKKQGIQIYLIGSTNNLGVYKFKSFNPWEAGFNVVVNVNREVFKQKYQPMLSKRFQIDETEEYIVNFRPTIWGTQYKALGNNVLISAFVGEHKEKPKEYSYVNIDGTLIPQIYDPFAAFLVNDQNSYLEDRKHSVHGKDQKEIICNKGKVYLDSWYDFGGKGTTKGSGQLRNHPGCISKKQGSFFDDLPCPCNRLTHGLSSKEFGP
eukprot:gene8036-12502_t